MSGVIFNILMCVANTLRRTGELAQLWISASRWALVGRRKWKQEVKMCHSVQFQLFHIVSTFNLQGTEHQLLLRLRYCGKGKVREILEI